MEKITATTATGHTAPPPCFGVTRAFNHPAKPLFASPRKVSAMPRRFCLTVRQVDRSPRGGEQPSHHGREELERQRVVARVEAVLVVGGAERRTGLPVRIVPVPIAQV